jgi:hypothetical protein
MHNFSPLSRYAAIATSTLELADGEAIIYLQRRFVPGPERLAFLQWHEVHQDQRLDQIAAQYLGNPEQFWRLCDANRALRPEQLVEQAGKQLRITLPEGIPGAVDD